MLKVSVESCIQTITYGLLASRLLFKSEILRCFRMLHT